MRNYYRVMLGKKNVFAEACIRDGYIGIFGDFIKDLTGQVDEDWREFNKKFIPLFIEHEPGKSRIAAGLAGGVIWSLVKGIKTGDIVISPVGSGLYRAGKIISEYIYRPEGPLQHCRMVEWMPGELARDRMSEGLRGSTGSVNTIVQLAQHTKELEALVFGEKMLFGPNTNSEDIENPAMFAMEKHLEEFLVRNWSQTELGRDYEVYTEDGESAGQQFQTDTGNIDILAISKDKKTILVIELKRGRASDTVVGQIQRYMGYVKDELAESGQMVKGVIIALEDDIRIRRALSVATNIEFYRYQMTFKLVKA